MNLKELYQEIILEHGKNPRNFGKTHEFNKDAKGHNPLCGDKVHVYLKLDENKKISDIKFEGEGCAISMASASIMTELMKNKEEPEVKELIDDFLKMIKDSPELSSKIISEDEKTKLMSLSGVKKYPMRVKCATLPWHTLVSAMTDKPGEVNTEKEDYMELKDKVISEIKKIYDPEIPVNIYDLGLIYDVKVDKENVVEIKMTLTTPNCPVAESLPKEVEDSVKGINEVKDAKLELVWEPPWDKSMMSEAAKLELNL